MGLKQELNATSAQDQFAKWARLDRQFSRMQAEYDNKGTIVYYPFSTELYALAKYKVHPAIQANTHFSFLSSQRSQREQSLLRSHCQFPPLGWD